MVRWCGAVVSRNLVRTGRRAQPDARPWLAARVSVAHLASNAVVRQGATDLLRLLARGSVCNGYSRRARDVRVSSPRAGRGRRAAVTAGPSLPVCVSGVASGRPRQGPSGAVRAAARSDGRWRGGLCERLPARARAVRILTASAAGVRSHANRGAAPCKSRTAAGACRSIQRRARGDPSLRQHPARWPFRRAPSRQLSRASAGQRPAPCVRELSRRAIGDRSVRGASRVLRGRGGGNAAVPPPVALPLVRARGSRVAPRHGRTPGRQETRPRARAQRRSPLPHAQTGE